MSFLVWWKPPRSLFYIVYSYFTAVQLFGISSQATGTALLFNKLAKNGVGTVYFVWW